MNITYHQELNRIEIRIREEQLPETLYESRMFLGCHIPGLLSCRLLHLDNQTCYSYDVTSRQSLRLLLLRHELRLPDLKWILKGILQTLDILEDYLLLPDHVLLEPEYIFLDQSTCTVYLLFLPTHTEQPVEGMKHLMEVLLPHLTRDDNSTIMFGYRFYRSLLDPDVRLASLLYFLAEADGGDGTELAGDGNGFVETIRRAESPASQSDLSLSSDDTAGSGGRCPPASMFRGKIPFRVIASAFAVLAAALLLFFLLHPAVLRNGPLRTIILITCGTSAAAAVIFILLRRGKADNGAPFPLMTGSAERIVPDERAGASEHDGSSGRKNIGLLTEESVYGNPRGKAPSPDIPPAVLRPLDPDAGFPEIRLYGRAVAIGKHPDLSDVVLHDPAVSRQHALITCRNGRYFLTDCNSKNGTFLNDSPLTGPVEKLLRPSDRIRFAGVTYVFHEEKGSPAYE